MKFSNETFYKRHNIELQRYISSEDSLHIININSKEKIKEQLSQKFYLSIEDGKDLKINVGGKKYETIVLTDVVEVVDDVYSLISILRNLLKPNGKLIITSVNTKYYFFIKLLEILRLKDKNSTYSYIHNKKIKNIASGVGFEFVNTNSKQIFPFNLFGFGKFFNKILEIIFFKFDLGIKTYSVFRLKAAEVITNKKTIIIPAKNEEGNLNELISRIPKFENCEIIISCGASKDRTTEVAEKIKNKEKFFDIKVISQ